MTPVQPIIPGMDLPVTVIAKDQPEYLPLPAHITLDGYVITRWRLKWWERFHIFLCGDMYLHILTRGRPLQPIYLSVRPPELQTQKDVMEAEGL